MKRITLILAVIIFSIIKTNAQWQQSSFPTGSGIIGFAVSGANIYVGTVTNGVYLSTNNGTSWTSIGSGINNTNIRSMAANGTDIYAGTFGGGMFLSTNNGQNWNAVNTGFSITNVVLFSINFLRAF